MNFHFGKSLHKGLELRATKEIDPVDTFKKEFKKDMLDDHDQLKHQEELENGIRLLEEYKLQEPFYNSVGAMKPIKAEEYFKLAGVKDPITNTPLKFEFMTGVVDAIFEDKKLCDYKTSSKKYSQEQVDESLQPTFYYLWYYTAYKELPKAFVYLVFLKRRKREPIQILETTRTKEDMSKLVTLCNEVYEKVEQRKFERTHSDFEYCDCMKYEQLLLV